MVLKVSCAIILNRNRFFVVQLGKETSHPFQWEFPGGKINPGESAEECIKREIFEELDIEIEIFSRFVAVQHDYGFRKVELIPFICAIKTGKIRLKEHVDYNWLTLEELRRIDMAGADKKLIQENELILEKYSREKMNNS